jgi:hypothetical protein
MTDTMVIEGAGAAGSVSDQTELWRTGEVLRDIAKGGMAGGIVGGVVGGLGGRLVMRVLALLHQDAIGAFTENGNRIGDFTLGGTLFLAVFGVIAGLLAGALWVIVSPWIPERPRVRAFLTAGVAIAMGTPLLIIGRNPDFVILDHDGMVVGLLIALVGLIGFAVALMDAWLDQRLPHVTAGRKGPLAIYGLVTLMGVALVLPVVLLVFLTSDEYEFPLRAGYGLFVVGLCTATWWGLRIRGRVSAPQRLVIAARGALLVTVTLGVLTALPHIFRALGEPS